MSELLRMWTHPTPVRNQNLRTASPAFDPLVSLKLVSPVAQVTAENTEDSFDDVLLDDLR